MRIRRRKCFYLMNSTLASGSGARGHATPRNHIVKNVSEGEKNAENCEPRASTVGYTSLQLGEGRGWYLKSGAPDRT